MKDFVSKDLTASRIIVNKQRDSDVKIIGEEIKQLRTHLSKAHDNEWNGSVLQVLFKNDAFERKYRSKVEKFLKDLLEEGEEFIVYHPPHANSEQEFEDNHQTFHIDKVDNDSHIINKAKQSIPVYSSQYEDTLKIIDTIVPEKAKEEKVSMVTCFNCLGNHHMKSCPDKLNYSRINMNKKDILVGSSVRYHTDEQNSAYTPGTLSNELRNALGLKDNQLPQFIYYMRVIGYPPGWMSEAVREESGLSLYDLDGKATGDAAPPPSIKGTLYDGAKFIEFPGFNMPVPNGFQDEWNHLKMPPLQAHQQLQEALKSPNIIFNCNVSKRKQCTSGNEDSKKHKNVEVKSCSPCTNEDSKRKSSYQQSDLNFGFKTPDSKPSNKRHSMSISVSPGTPILEQGNPFQKLPDADKFAQGITEHLPFENLPDAVGSYEKMRGVISCVQQKLNCINS